MIDSNLQVSVVIPVYNNGDTLNECLDSLLNQSLNINAYEIIVVDNNSTDKSREILKKYAAKHNNVKFFKQHRQGPSPTRNKGTFHAKAAIILFLDADMIADSDLLKQHLLSHEYHTGSVLGYFETGWEKSSNSFLQYLDKSSIQNAFNFKDNSIVNYKNFYTGNVSIKKKMVEKIGGFDENYILYGVEDIDLGYRLYCYGDKILFNKKAKCIHKYTPDYTSYKTKKKKAGYSLGYFLDKFPNIQFDFRFEPIARLTLPLFNLFFLMLSPLLLIPTNKLSWIRYNYYHWSIRFAMFRYFLKYRSKRGNYPSKLLR